MKGGFTTTTRDTYESEENPLSVTLTGTDNATMVHINAGAHPTIDIDIRVFDELVAAVEVLQDRARARRMK